MMLQEFASVYADVDLLLTPTAPTTAFPLGDRTADPMTMYVNDVCTIPSEPGRSSRHLGAVRGGRRRVFPVGVQLLGPALSEPTIYQAAAALEAERMPRAQLARTTTPGKPTSSVVSQRARTDLCPRSGSSSSVSRSTSSWPPRPSCSAAAPTSSPTSPTPTCAPPVSGSARHRCR